MSIKGLEWLESEREQDDVVEASQAMSIISKQLFRMGNYFLWYVFQRIPVYYVPNSKAIAWTDGTAVYVTPNFLKLSSDLKLFVIRHELYHITFFHPFQVVKRMAKAKTILERNIVSLVHNIISDAVVNGIIMSQDKNLGRLADYSSIDKDDGIPARKDYSGFVDPEKIGKLLDGDVVKLGFSNAVEKLLYLIKRGDVEVEVTTPAGNAIDITHDSLVALAGEFGRLYVRIRNIKNKAEIRIVLSLDTCSRSESGGQGGGKKNKNGGKCPLKEEGAGKVLIKKPVSGFKPKTPEEINDIVRKAIDFEKFKRATHNKSAGTGVAGDTVYELLSAEAKKPEWEAMLTSTLTSFLSRDMMVSWHFVNRRTPFRKPGIRYLTIPDIHILLDVSGSMLDESLERALKRVLYIVETYPDVKVKLYQWSGGCKLPEDIDRRFAEQIKRYKKLRVMTGGTEIGPALDMALKYVTKKDAVVVLTDGEIFDIDRPEVQQKFRKLTDKAGVVIFASLGYIPEHLPKKVKKIRIED